MNKVRLGLRLRALRLRGDLRQIDVARLSGISRETVSKVERGGAGRLTLDKLVTLAGVLGAEFDGDLRWRGGEIERLLNAHHAALSEQVVAWIRAQPGWTVQAEVSFAIGGERGIVDFVAFHAPTGLVALGELKTGVYDVLEMLGTFHRKIRLGRQIASSLGVPCRGVAAWLIVADTKTNRRRIAAHRSLVASQLPADGRVLRPWFRRPAEPIRGVAFWTDVGLNTGWQIATGRQRVRRRAGAAEAANRARTTPSASPDSAPGRGTRPAGRPATPGNGLTVLTTTSGQMATGRASRVAAPPATTPRSAPAAAPHPAPGSGAPRTSSGSP